MAKKKASAKKQAEQAAKAEAEDVRENALSLLGNHIRCCITQHPHREEALAALKVLSG